MWWEQWRAAASSSKWGGGRRDLLWGNRGMRWPGQEIVGLKERGTRLLRKQAEAERQRGRSAGGGAGRGLWGQECRLCSCSGQVCWHLLLHPLLDLLPGPCRPCQSCSSPMGPSFLLHGQTWSRAAPQRCSQLIFCSWPGYASVSPTLKSPCASITGSGRTYLGFVEMGTKCLWG